MTRHLTNQDVATILETKTELMATPNARGQARTNAPDNFWWAVGQVFGMKPGAAKRAVAHAERYGMSRQAER